MIHHWKIWHHWGGKGLLLLFLIGLAAYQFRLSLQEQQSFAKSPHHQNSTINSQNPYLLTTFANQVYLQEGDPAKAQSLFQQALVYNPFFIPAWIGLCELKSATGQTKEALSIFSYLNTLTKNITRYRWQKALLSYQLEQYNALADDLSYLISYLPKKRKQALKLAFSVWTDPYLLLEKIGKANISHLFKYTLHKKRLDKALTLWPTYKQAIDDPNKSKIILRFIYLLLHNKRILLAKKIWKEQIHNEEGLYNSDFAHLPLQTAFTWHIYNQKGSQWERIPEVNGSIKFLLHIHFAGSDNMRYTGFSQNVPVTPQKSYTLSGSVRTRKITTDQRPFFEVVGFQCRAEKVFSESFKENQEWTPFALTFTPPQGCEVMTIRLRRNKSKNIDNLIAGDIWIKDMKLEMESKVRYR